ncbi:type 4a pilus biogenesis protein PilO [candidate division WOR-3 bacterium]|nr:type 4a pilus biogenesis protein PilO [candidate division WOR-3 bacterium]
MALLERRVLLIGLVVCILLGVFAFFVLYQPQLKARQASTAEVEDLNKQLEETRQRVKQMPRLRARLVELEEANAAFSARVVPRDEVLTTVRRLADIAQGQRVRFLEVSPPGLDTLLREETSSTPVRSVPFMVTVQGRYMDVGRYVESLDRFPYFVRVPDFEVTAREDIRPEIEVKLLVNLYTSSLASGGRI